MTDKDTSRLLQLGYKQTLHRSLLWTQNASICLCSVLPLTAITGLSGQGLLYGGPAVFIWGWIATEFFSMLVGLAMSDIFLMDPESPNSSAIGCRTKQKTAVTVPKKLSIHLQP